jgi:LacI family transcriptional regulator
LAAATKYGDVVHVSQLDELNGRPMATIRDVADHLGISVSTVSRALSGHREVSDQTRQLVVDAAQALDYRPNTLARALRAKRSQSLGLILPTIESPVYSSAAAALERVVARHGYSLFFASSNDDPRTDAGLLRDMADHHTDGIAHVPCTPDGGRDVIARSGIPVLEVFRYSQTSEFDAVVYDDDAATYELTSHLVGLGHRRIGIILGEEPWSTTQERISGFAGALKAAHLALDPSLICLGSYTRGWGNQAMKALVSRPEPPTAIIVGSVQLISGSLAAINSLGIDVPGELSLACIGTAPWYEALVPALTAIQWRDEDIGLRMAELLLRMVAVGFGTDRSRSIQRVPGQLVVGGSTAPPATTGR